MKNNISFNNPNPNFLYKMSFIGIAFLMLSLTACSHPMRITNQDEYFATPIAQSKDFKIIGVTSANSSDPENSKYVNAIVDGLKRGGNFEKVIYPYNASMHDSVCNYAIDITVKPEYTGRGSNFFVNWPGFLIFAPAIWGYGYNADIETVANISKNGSGQSQQINVVTNYKFRQAEIDRTWTEIGWLEFGLIPLIGGAAFMEYDPDVTGEFIAKVSPTYGEYVARKITETINNH